MGRLALAGLHPEGMPATRYLAAVWALYLDWLTKFGEDGQKAVTDLWASLAEKPDVAQADTSTASPAAPRRSTTPSSSPTRPGDKRTGRPSRADMEAWALASAANGTNFIGDLPAGQGGAADKVGG